MRTTFRIEGCHQGYILGWCCCCCCCYTPADGRPAPHSRVDEWAYAVKVPQLLLLLLSRGLREFARWLVQLRYDTFNFRFGRGRTFSPVQGIRIPFVPRSYSLPLSLYAIVHSSTVLVALNSLHLITIQCGMPGHIDQAGSSARPGAGGEWKVMEDAISGPSHKLYICECVGVGEMDDCCSGKKEII